MKFKTFLLLLPILLLTTCIGYRSDNINNTAKIPDKRIKHPIKTPKNICEQMALGDRPDSEQKAPSQKEEKRRIESSYNQTQSVDTVLIINRKNYRLILSYYCLKDSILTVPAAYDLENHPPHQWKTHPFTTSVLFLKGQDTLLNREFRASNFYPFFKDNFGGNLKRSGSILMPSVSYNAHNSVRLNYSISIPASDISVGMSLIIESDGSYKIQTK